MLAQRVQFLHYTVQEEIFPFLCFEPFSFISWQKTNNLFLPCSPSPCHSGPPYRPLPWPFPFALWSSPQLFNKWKRSLLSNTGHPFHQNPMVYPYDTGERSAADMPLAQKGMVRPQGMTQHDLMQRHYAGSPKQYNQVSAASRKG